MPARPSPRVVCEIMLDWIDLDLDSYTEIYPIWAGYGHVCIVHAKSRDPEPVSTTLILKLVSPPKPQGLDEGHLRKMFSYRVEHYFYQHIGPRLGDDAAVPKFLASTSDMEGKPGADKLRDVSAVLMTDLRSTGFPIAGETATSAQSETQVYGALTWLANFHRRSWDWLPQDLDTLLLPPIEEERRRRAGEGAGSTIWLNGGYTYFATRRKETGNLKRDRYSEWSAPFCDPFRPGSDTASVAELVANFLTPRGRPFETYIHGDVKPQNLFATPKGDRVAFIDFQYVGLGFGVCDLAKLFTCGVPLGMLIDGRVPSKLALGGGELDLLKQYHDLLVSGSSKGPVSYPWDAFVRHWETALVDWCRFQASWGFWGNQDWLEARVRHILADQTWRDWLAAEVDALRAEESPAA